MSGRTERMRPVVLDIVIVAGETMRLFWSSGITERDETRIVTPSRDSRGGVGSPSLLIVGCDMIES